MSHAVSRSLSFFLSLLLVTFCLCHFDEVEKKCISFSLSLHGVDWTPTGRKEGGVGARERDRAARVDREMAYLQKEKCGVKAVLFSLHSLDCSVVP